MEAKWFFLLVALIGFNSASAQNEKVLSGDAITESAVIQALTPAAGSSVEAPRTRGIRPNRENAPGMIADTPAKTASASLLITFQTNSAQLTSDAKKKLDVVGEALNSDRLNDYQFSIQGHADPSGNPVSNLKLSQRRAESVREYLVQYKHIENQRLKAIGKGDKEPLNTANPVAPENRRVTIVNLGQ
jgi:outer membrane protein OmpA-like peptidoglycan-associated protein